MKSSEYVAEVRSSIVVGRMSALVTAGSLKRHSVSFWLHVIGGALRAALSKVGGSAVNLTSTVKRAASKTSYWSNAIVRLTVRPTKEKSFV